MKVSEYISKRERKLILIVAFAAFIFSIVGSIVYSVKADIKRTEYFREQEENRKQGKLSFSGPYCTPDRHPQFLSTIILVVGAMFFSICLTKKYILSFLLTITALSRFLSWLIYSRKQLFDDVSDFVHGIDRVFYNAGTFDLTVLLILSILFFWQISILLRMLIKTLQRKTELP